MSFVLSADAGGTFLDLVLVDDDGRIGAGKALHTPESPSIGIRAALAAASSEFGITAEEALADTRFVFHGTTVTTNGMVERKGVNRRWTGTPDRRPKGTPLIDES